MFDRLFRRAERKIDSVVAKYVRRVLVAVPLLIAALFATAAIAVKLVELYGPVNGYAMMAGGFTVLAGVIALFSLTGRATPVEEAEAAAAESAEAVKDKDEKPFVSPDILSLITAAAPIALPGVARIAARNLPMLVALAIIGYLFSRYAGSDGSPEANTDGESTTSGDDLAAAAAATRADEERLATMATRAAAA